MPTLTLRPYNHGQKTKTITTHFHNTYTNIYIYIKEKTILPLMKVALQQLSPLSQQQEDDQQTKSTEFDHTIITSH